MATVRSSSKTTTTSSKSPKSPVSPSGTGTNSPLTSPSIPKNQVISGLNEGQEDIETIAKQISDHAEAIYQTWKARGLAPTEILNCHATAPTNDTFGKSFKTNQNIKNSLGHSYNKDSPVTELIVNAPDMSNNNLEKLVNTFVSEDKARIAARKRNSNSSPIGGSSIQHALKKFERSDTSPVKQISSPSSSPSSSLNNKNSVNNVLKNTIDQVLPKTELTSSVRNNTSSNSSNSINNINSNSTPKSASPNPSPQKPQTPAKPANLINHVPSWPLKNRLGTSPNTSPNSALSSNSIKSKSPSPTKDIIDSSKIIIQNSSSTLSSSPLLSSSSSTSSPSSTPIQKTSASRKADLLDEVSREEERLINALKATTLITTNNDENITNWKKPEVSTTTASPNTVTATWNGIQLKPVAGPTQNSTIQHQRIDEMHQNQTFIKTKGPRAPRTENVPHPELSSSRNLNVRTTSASPVRPFLTRGSVAERVLIFERCPEITKAPPRNAIKEPMKFQVSNFVISIFIFLNLIYQRRYKVPRYHNTILAKHEAV